MSESGRKENVLLQVLRFNQKGNGVGDVFIKDQNISVEIPFAIPGDTFEAPLSNIKRKKIGYFLTQSFIKIAAAYKEIKW